MANIICTWRVEEDGVNLYDESGNFLVNFISMVLSAEDQELYEEMYCEWDGENTAYRFDEDGVSMYKTYKS
jgi:hypothetical protein